MADDRDVQVHLLPDLAPPGRLAGGVAVVIDVLRATTTLIHALAAGLVDFLCEVVEVRLNDSARLAWDCFENHGRVLQGALEVSRGGAILRRLGYDDDIKAAAQIDHFALVPELRKEPLRVEVGAV